MKAIVLNNLKRNLSEQVREAESIATVENCIQNLATERQTNNQIGDTTVDNDISLK